MSTPNWTVFAAVVLLATAALLVLSRASARVLRAADAGGEEGHDSQWDGDVADTRPAPTGGTLLANVALTHGLLAVGLLALVWYASIPVASVGIGPVSGASVAVGLGIGVGLYLASEATTIVAARVGIEPDERLRAYLAPTRPIEWVVLLLAILPLIAAAEELLFRGVLVGALGVGFGLSPWALAVGSSILFGLAHSAQGGVGVVVTAALGFVLAVAFVLSESLVVVVLAHYTIDALEFVIREGVLD